MKTIRYCFAVLCTACILCIGCGSSNPPVQDLVPYASCPMDSRGALPVSNADTNIYTLELSTRKAKTQGDASKFWVKETDTNIIDIINKRALTLLSKRFEICGDWNVNNVQRKDVGIWYTTTGSFFSKHTVTRVSFWHTLAVGGGRHGRPYQTVNVYIRSDGASTYSSTLALHPI